MPTILTLFGRRAGAIKMASVVTALQQDTAFESVVCVSFQERQSLDSILDFFGISRDHSIDLTSAGTDPAQLITGMISGLQDILDQVKPDLVLVSGDATTSVAASLACYYRGIDVGHVDAGLRSQNLDSPWPEEMNRRLISRNVTLHFASTAQCQQNLLAEGIEDAAITVTGSSFVDSLWQSIDRIESTPQLRQGLDRQLPFLPPGKAILLVSGQRQEYFGAGLGDVCRALNTLAATADMHIVFPVSMNSAMQGPVFEKMEWHDNVHLIEPPDYLPSAHLINQADIVLTDAVAVQQGAISLGKPTLVMRDNCELREGEPEGLLQLVGTDPTHIVDAVRQLLGSTARKYPTHKNSAAYGDGKAAGRIIQAIKEHLS